MLEPFPRFSKDARHPFESQLTPYFRGTFHMSREDIKRAADANAYHRRNRRLYKPIACFARLAYDPGTWVVTWGRFTGGEDFVEYFILPRESHPAQDQMRPG